MFDWLKALFGLSNCRRCKFRRMWGLYCGFKYKKSLRLKSSAWNKYGCWHYVDVADTRGEPYEEGGAK